MGCSQRGLCLALTFFVAKERIYWVIIPFTGGVKLALSGENPTVGRPADRSVQVALTAGATVLLSALSFMAWKDANAPEAEAASVGPNELPGKALADVESTRQVVSDSPTSDENRVLELEALRTPFPSTVRDVAFTYYPNGGLMMTSEYLVVGEERTRDGLTISYYPESKIEKVRSYWRDGKLNGLWSYSRSDGSLYISLEFNQGIPDGELTIFGVGGHRLVSGLLRANGHGANWPTNEELLSPDRHLEALTAVVSNPKMLQGKVGDWSWYSQNTGNPYVIRSYDWEEPDTLIGIVQSR